MKGLITRASIKALTPDPEKDRYLWDTKVAGFFVKVTPKGTQSYYLRYRMGGRNFPTRRFFIGRVDWMSVDKARELAGAAKLDVHRGIDPFEEQARSMGRLVSDIGHEWLTSSKVKKKARSSREDARIFTKHILPAFGRRFIQQVTRRDIDTFHGKLSETPALANRALAVLSSIFSYAERHGYREEHTNPCRGVQRFPEHARERFLQAEELRRFLSTIDRCEHEKLLNPTFLHLVKLLLLTGCRRDELRLLQWDHVDLVHGTLHLPDSKTGPRTIYLSEPAVDVLKKIKKRPGNAYVFVSPAKPGRPIAATALPWEILCREAGLNNFRIHDLRHCYASMAVLLGIPLFSVGKLLGHARSETTARYSHLDSGPLKAATASIGNALKAFMDNPPTPAEVVPIAKPQ